MQQFLFIYCFISLCALFSCKGKSDDRYVGELAKQSLEYIDKNRLDSAVVMNLKILENIDTAAVDNFGIIANTYNNLGDIFYKATIFDKAFRMYKLGLEYARTLNDKTEESHSRRGIWRCSYMMKLPEKDTAIANFATLIPYIKSDKEISSLYNNITGYFMYNGNSDSAFLYNQIAIDKSADSLTLYRNWGIRSELFINEENYDSAWHYAWLASHSTDIYTRAASIFRLGRISEYENKDSSIYFLKYYGSLLDSINNIKTRDSINVILYKKQLSAVQDKVSRDHTIMTILTLTLLVVACGLTAFFIMASRRNRIMRHEAVALKKRLYELNEELNENYKKVEDYKQYSEQYQDLQARQKHMEETFVAQLVDARNKCINTFKKSSFYKKLPSLIDSGDGILKLDKRKEMQDVINKDFMLLRHSLATYFNISDEEFTLFCLSASGFSTKECAACRGVTMSAIRMQRMRINNKIKSFFSTDTDLSDILL